MDINEINTVELVRYIHSTRGYIDIDGNSCIFAIGCSAREYQAVISAIGSPAHLVNPVAFKHVRRCSFTVQTFCELFDV